MKQNTVSISQIRTVAIPVTDQERSLAFYTDVLGFEKTVDAPFGPGQRWIEVTLPGGGATLAIPPLGDLRPGIDTGIRFETADAQKPTTRRSRPPAQTSTPRSYASPAFRRCSPSATRTETASTSSSACDVRVRTGFTGRDGAMPAARPASRGRCELSKSGLERRKLLPERRRRRCSAAPTTPSGRRRRTSVAPRTPTTARTRPRPQWR